MRNRASTLHIGSLMLALATFAVSCSAHAEEPSREGELVWNPDWPKFRPLEYVLTATTGAAAIGAFFLLDARSKPRWTGGILFDDTARVAFRLHSEDARINVRTASNITAMSALVLVVGFDSMIVPLVRRKSDIGLQLALMDAEGIAVSSLLTTLTFKTVGRARPPYAECERDPSYDRLCNSARFTSFPSGHSSQAATAAGLSCAHHTHLALYGNRVADGIACGVTAALAVTTGVFRLMGDRHYVTDVLAGEAIGFSIGYGLPTLLHYTASSGAKTNALALTPLAGAQYGLAATGTF